jgi:rod shape-determining protein MreD
VNASRWLLAAVLLVVAGVVDVALLARSPLADLGPDLTLLVVVSFALLEGGTTGAAVGVLAGLVADLTPPATGPLGLAALGYGLAGVVAGRWHRPARRATLLPAAVATALAAAAGALTLGGVRLLTAALAGLGGRPGPVAGGAAAAGAPGGDLARGLAGALVAELAVPVATAAVLGLVVVPAVLALDRRTAPDAAEVLRW